MGVHLCEVALLVFVEPRILSRIGTVPVPGFTRSLKPVRCGDGGFSIVIQAHQTNNVTYLFYLTRSVPRHPEVNMGKTQPSSC